MSEAALVSCDRGQALAAATTTAPAAAVSHPRGVLATTVLASSLAFVDGSIVNVGLPAIAQSFSADGASLSWVINGYLLPLSALLLLGGAAGDRFGHRRLLLIGVGLFAAASLLCAAAPGLPWLIAARVLQGVGAAMLMPTSLAILGSSFSGDARGRAIGIWAAAGAGAGAIGPLLGGWLIDVVGWRAMFLVNVPIAAAALAFALRFVQDAPRVDQRRLDVAGALLATAGLASLTWGLTAASGPAGLHGWSVAALVVGAALFALFLAVQRKRGERAMMPLHLFAAPRFVGLTLVTFLLYGALGSLLVLVPYVLIQLAGYSATAAGAALLPIPIVIALMSPTLGRIAGRLGPRRPLTAGPLLVALGFVLTTRVDSGGSYWTTTFPAMLVIAFGMACAVAPLTNAVLDSVQPDHTGIASGLNSAVARTGGLVSTALLSFIFAAQGAALQRLFEVAMLCAAAAALAAAVCAFVWLKPAPPAKNP
jgi:EmrB/QacA subfamily drug resistance transporter